MARLQAIDEHTSELSPQDRGVLACMLVLPQSREKSAHLLVLKHLRRRGWKVDVLTLGAHGDETRSETWCGITITSISPRSIQYRLQREVAELRRRIGEADGRRWSSVALDEGLRVLSMVTARPDRFASARRELVQWALRSKQRYRAVLSLYHPYSSHLVAREVSQHLESPWIAMTKDYYSWPDSLVKGRWKRARNRIKRRLETTTLGSSAVVLAVNDNIRDYLADLLPAGRKVETLSHCYDDDLAPVELNGNKTQKRFELVSVGLTAATEVAGLEILFRAINSLSKQRLISPSTFCVKFVGHGAARVQACAAQHECLSFLETVAPLPHSEAMNHLQQASALLFQQAPWGTRRRLPEYLAARKPILAFPSLPHAMSERVLRAYGAARIANTEQEMANGLIEWLRGFEQHGGLRIQCNEELVQSFAASRQAAQLENVILNAKPGLAVLRSSKQGVRALGS